MASPASSRTPVGFHAPDTSWLRPPSGITPLITRSPTRTSCFSTSTVAGCFGSRPIARCSQSTSSLSIRRHGIPSMVQLPKKISPKEAPTMALMPHCLSDSGACSREDPQPKLIPATSTEAPSYTFWLKGCSGSCLRASSKAWSPSPSLVTVLRNRAGMIRSVSMSLPGTGIARPATCRRALSVIALSPARRLQHLPHVGDRAVERGRRGHGGAHEQSPPGGAALSPDEVAVAGGRAPLAAPQLVVVHAQAHLAARVAPLQARLPEDLLQPLRLPDPGP